VHFLAAARTFQLIQITAEGLAVVRADEGPPRAFSWADLALAVAAGGAAGAAAACLLADLAWAGRRQRHGRPWSSPRRATAHHPRGASDVRSI